MSVLYLLCITNTIFVLIMFECAVLDERVRQYGAVLNSNVLIFVQVYYVRACSCIHVFGGI